VDDGAAAEAVRVATTTRDEDEDKDFKSEHLPKPLLHPAPQYADEYPQ
jgi:hypothetical protein